MAVTGCKSKQKLVKSEFIEKQTIDTIQVPAERSTLTGTLSYIPGTGIVFTGIDQKQTAGIETSVSISGDTLKVETRTQEKNIPVVTTSTTVENKYVEEKENTGCSEIVMVTPPNKDGKVAPAILAAAQIAGVDRIFKVGGAQAIAALAHGTESIPKVDKIVGPGNAYVAEAKKQVFGRVSIDMIAGPSEILVVAGSTCVPEYVAADLLSQAEHDKMASAVLVTDSRSFAEAVSAELERQIPLLPRAEIARASIDNNGKIIVAEGNLSLAIYIANEIAPEHLELCMDSPFDYLDKVKHAGSVFMGKYCPEALGDYLAGPNHTLPTGGTARFSSPLSVDDFVKKTQYTYFTRAALEKVADDVAMFAHKEGLDAHARSVIVRFGKSK